MAANRRDVGLPYRSLKAYRNVFRMVTPVRAPLDARVPPQPRLIVAELYKSREDTLSSAVNSSITVRALPSANSLRLKAENASTITDRERPFSQQLIDVVINRNEHEAFVKSGDSGHQGEDISRR